jgi:hypothetical protein
VVIWTPTDRTQYVHIFRRPACYHPVAQVHLHGKEGVVVVGAMGGVDKQEHWFTEGFDTADLQEAKALLEEVF